MSSLGPAELPFDQFAEDGRLSRIISVQDKLDSGNITIGLRSQSGVVLATEGNEQYALRRLYNVEGRIGVAVSGVGSIGQTLVDIAKTECSSYCSNFGADMNLRELQTRLATYIHGHTISSVIQPLEVRLLCASYEEAGPMLYVIEPSGDSRGSYGAISGHGCNLAMNRLKGINLSSLSLEELAKEATVMSYLANEKARIEIELGLIGGSTGRFELASPRLLTECHNHANMVMQMLSRSDKH
uniref:Proteasome subunit alpha type-3 n=1 Tax=Cacopsylla melanoneura TaxID=428564 RepID=A0A8D8V190_9HEMI